jgi:hypothetical protein
MHWRSGQTLEEPVAYPSMLLINRHAALQLVEPSWAFQRDRVAAVVSSVCRNLMHSSFEHLLSLLSFESRLTSQPNP